MGSAISSGKTSVIQSKRQRSAPSANTCAEAATPFGLPIPSLVETLEDDKLRERYFGYRTPVDSADALAKAYVSGSIRVCHGFFSVLVRRDFAEVARKRGVRIGS
jgi:hypothetical protein